MHYWLAANIIVLTHLGFIIFVTFGGLLLLRSRKWAWVHLPSAIWGSTVEFMGWICPLTPLENRLREKGGHEIYSEDFIEHYIMPIIYPSGYTRGFQIVLGVSVIVINAVLYSWAFKRRRSIM
ncbi:MAG: DUF2784 domain-containing protein [Nitrospiraceae bacterium]|nr:MAG: DUF2784 domain-containing protein [Nitrospiraceae bacterium]